MSFNITGTGSCVPDNTADNKYFESLVETSDEWITTRTGIKKRHILKNQTLLDISVKAAQSALTEAGVKAFDLDLIICATMQGDYIVPSFACLIQKHIGAKCPAFDINAACSGFIYALDVADGLFKSGKYKKILIVSCDQLSKILDYSDRSTCVLFGDGAGAAVLECGDSLKYIKLTAKGDCENLVVNSHLPKSPFNENALPQGYLKMNGQEIFKYAVSTVVKAVRDAEKTAGIKPEHIDYFLLHQANGRIIEMAQSTLKQPAEKFPFNYHEYGNTSAASIPLLLDELNKNGKLKKGGTLFLSAFGGGLTSGACIIKWQSEKL